MGQFGQTKSARSRLIFLKSGRESFQSFIGGSDEVLQNLLKMRIGGKVAFVLGVGEFGCPSRALTQSLNVGHRALVENKQQQNACATQHPAQRWRSWKPPEQDGPQQQSHARR